jgi:diacylglycerol kinase family enzyme
LFRYTPSVFLIISRMSRRLDHLTLMPPVVSATVLPPETDRVVISVNPIAGPKSLSAPRADGLAAALRLAGIHCETFSDLDAAAAQARRWHAEGRLRAWVGVGGDGTAHELINRAAEGLPLAFLPAGNSNLLAVHLRLSKDPKELCRTIVAGRLARLDAGEANGRLFAIMASCGFDAEVVRRIHLRRRGHISLRTYVKAVLATIADYPYPEIRADVVVQPSRLHCAGETPAPQYNPAAHNHSEQQISARWLFAFNLPCYGGGFNIAPRANAADGLLDVCTLRSGRFWPGMWYAVNVLLGRHERLGGCTTLRAQSLRLSSASEVPYQLDGEPGGMLPLELRVLPGRLSLVLPADNPTA